MKKFLPWLSTYPSLDVPVKVQVGDYFVKGYTGAQGHSLRPRVNFLEEDVPAAVKGIITPTRNPITNVKYYRMENCRMPIEWPKKLLLFKRLSV